MPALDWSQCPAVESIPGKVSGAWVFKDTRMPVSSRREVTAPPSVAACCNVRTNPLPPALIGATT